VGVSDKIDLRIAQAGNPDALIAKGKAAPDFALSTPINRTTGTTMSARCWSGKRLIAVITRFGTAR
jgi:hypothetical protein